MKPVMEQSDWSETLKCGITHITYYYYGVFDELYMYMYIQKQAIIIIFHF